MAQCWVEVDGEKVRANFRALKNLVGEDVAVIAVVKADAYGLGAREVGRVLAEEGALFLAVTRMEEGAALREAGISAPILLMSPTPRADVARAVECGLTLCLSTRDEAEAAQQEAQAQGRTASCGLKINTGMNRFGALPEAAPDLAAFVAAQSNLDLQTCWTHFADAGEAKPIQVEPQFGRFNHAIGPISRAGGLAPLKFHCANSSALLRFPSMRLSCVRSGTLLFGQFPSGPAAEAGKRDGLVLSDPFCVRARVLSIQEVEPGQSVGYGGEWRASKASRVATLGIGFADGLSLSPESRDESALAKSGREVLRGIKGIASGGAIPAARRAWWTDMDGKEHLAPIVGRIAMQSCHVDVTALPNVRVGDALRVFQRRTSTGAHLPRVFLSP
jgi:alanine racemase